MFILRYCDGIIKTRIKAVEIGIISMAFIYRVKCQDIISYRERGDLYGRQVKSVYGIWYVCHGCNVGFYGLQYDYKFLRRNGICGCVAVRMVI